MLLQKHSNKIEIKLDNVGLENCNLKTIGFQS